MSIKKFEFCLQRDAKLAMVLFMACILVIFVSFFTLQAFLQGCSAAPSQGHLYTSKSGRGVQVKAECFISWSLSLVIVAFIFLVSAENFHEKHY